VFLWLGQRDQETCLLKWSVENSFIILTDLILMIDWQIGRGMRLSPRTGKGDCRIIDFVDSNARVRGVISAPTLFGLDPSLFNCDGKPV